MLVRHGTGRDRHEAREPRLGRERVVVRAVEAAVGHAVADREQLPLGVEEESELGLLDQVVGQRGQALAAFDQLVGEPAGAVDGLPRLSGGRLLGELVERAIAERDEAGEASGPRRARSECRLPADASSTP